MHDCRVWDHDFNDVFVIDERNLFHIINILSFKNSTGIHMNLFSNLIKQFKWLFALTFVASLLSAGASLAVIAQFNDWLASPTGNLDLLRLGASLVILFICGVLAQALMTSLGHRVVYRLRLMMVKRVLDTDIEHIEKIGSSPLYAALTKDITTIGQAFNRLPFMLYNSILVVGGFVYMASLSLPLFLMSGLTLFVGSFVAYRLMFKMRTLMRVVRETDDEIYAAYQGAIDGRYELKLNEVRRQHFYNTDFEPVVNFARRTEVKADRFWVLSLNWAVVLILSLIGAILLAGEVFGVSRAVVATYVLVLLFLRTPISDLMSGLPIVMGGTVGLRKIDSLTLAAYQEGFKALPAPSEILHQQAEPILKLSQVGYEYQLSANEDYQFCLGPVDLSVKAGEILFIVGGNGSGKSTLAKILTGLYPPSSGSITLNGIEIGDHNRAWYRSHFSAIFANFHLFKSLIGPEGQFDKTMADTFLDRLRMRHKVNLDSGHLSTTKLSQGQRKRMALLLAYVEERSILLLDEWAADQDPIYREFFYEQLLPELQAQGKTIIAISHDDRYFHHADRIIRCESGLIVAIDEKQPAPLKTSEVAFDQHFAKSLDNA